jgi:uncharacterized spore protein YtfJ
MGTQSLLDSLAERLGATATVRNVYGEPIKAEGKTIIPVARVGFGLGAGTGKRGDRKREGGGGGGGMGAVPAGVLEITPAGTRFIPAGMARRTAAALLGGFILGWLWARRR